MSQKPTLLSRDGFREFIFARDRGQCVFCKQPAIDAHHILERRLWSDGGYYADNGVSVCGDHHRACEMTTLSVEDARLAGGIAKIIVPDQFYASDPIDKWGNPILANGMRLRGELFFDESVQKILAEGKMLARFTNRVKYPRTYHLPWSPGIHDDDRVMSSLDRFIGQRVIVHLKMDGENTTCYNDYIHARSIDGRNHTSRDWIKGFWGKFRFDIPQDWRTCLENLYAKHSIGYDDLPSYAIGINVWNERNVCLSWDETKEWFDLLGIEPCPILYDGVYDEKMIRSLYDEKRDWATREGYVMRIADSFPYGEYRHCVGKYVRKAHIQTAPHAWLNRSDFEVNQLRK